MKQFKKQIIEAKQQVGRMIARLRQSAKLTQVEMAERLGVSQSYIVALESGEENLGLETLVKLANVFKMILSIDFKRSRRRNSS